MMELSVTRTVHGGGLEAVVKRLASAAETGVTAAAEATRMEAADRAKMPAVRASLRVSTAEHEGDTVSVRVYNDTALVPWSSYVEFGTGLNVDNEGIEDAIRLHRPWRIPRYLDLDALPPGYEESVAYSDSHGGYERTMDGKLVFDGLYPTPYMKPAAVVRRMLNREEVAQALREAIRREVGQ
ncbi:MAG: hypothetical protein IJX53_00685 [Clostridia bacterium]|nr:hypothetical protein [Clostridia bacterium]